jgi:hypothetical protein
VFVYRLGDSRGLFVDLSPHGMRELIFAIVPNR